MTKRRKFRCKVCFSIHGDTPEGFHVYKIIVNSLCENFIFFFHFGETKIRIGDPAILSTIIGLLSC